ncbi:MAG: hypothetical protein QM572_01465 [Nocardioides sp.]|uniref:COG4705 family protein n=1 Tax=Nocardioides sp. TaxID=35761 RepID=UPI0039E5CB65
MDTPPAAARTPARNRTEHALSKVPEATIAFWVIKVVTTGMGEIVADAFAEKVGIPITATVGGLLMAAALWWQFRQDRYKAVPYWMAAAMVSVFGTSVGDGPRRGFGWSFWETSIIFGVLVAVILGVWFALERTLSIHSITTRRREVFYWLTVGGTFALGTAVGDLATYLGSPFIQSAIIFGVVMLVAYLGFRFVNLNAVFAFWTAYVMTRPLGASIADWTWVPKPFGAGLGKDLTGVVSVVIFVVMLAWMAKTRNGEPAAVDGEDVDAAAAA